MPPSRAYVVVRDTKGVALIEAYFMEEDVLIEAIRQRIHLTDKQDEAIRGWWSDCFKTYNLHETIDGLTVIICWR